MRKLVLFLLVIFLGSQLLAKDFYYQKIKIKNKIHNIKVFKVSYYLRNLKSLNVDQKKIANKVFMKAREFDLEYTMTAIAFKESSFGRTMYNLRDGELGSYGVFHNLVSSVYDRYVRYKPVRKNNEISIKLSLAKRLIDDFDFSFSQSLAELKYWENTAIVKGKRWDKWRYSILHYNGGTFAEYKPKAWEYYYNIVNIIKALRILKDQNRI